MNDPAPIIAPYRYAGSPRPFAELRNGDCFTLAPHGRAVFVKCRGGELYAPPSSTVTPCNPADGSPLSD